MNRRCAMLLLVFCLGLMLSVGAEAGEDTAYLPLREQISSQSEQLITWKAERNVPLYAAYLARYADAPLYAGEDVACERVAEGEFLVSAPESAFYCLKLTYAPANEDEVEPQRTLTIDGSAAFQGSQSVTLRWWWADARAPIRNAAGDEVHPSQVRLNVAQQVVLHDADGYVAEGLRFYLEKGEHTIRFGKIVQEADLQALALAAPEVIPTYAELSAGYDRSMVAAQGVVFQAESSVCYKNSASLKSIPRDDPGATPFEFGYKRMNTLHSWDGGHEAVWSFTVPEDGLYTVSLRCAVGTQNLPVHRTMTVDGKIPCRELAAYRFDYDEDFQVRTLKTAQGEDILLYLQAGEHTLGTTAVLGDYYDVLLSLQEDDQTMADLMLDIIMIIGANPDVNYDYKIEKSIPDIVQRLRGVSESLLIKAERMNEICGGSSLVESSLRSCAALLERISGNVRSIQKHVSDLTNIQTTLATWQDSLSGSSFYVDAVQVGASGDQLNPPSSLFAKISSTVRSFLISFTKDYDNVGAAEEDQRVVLDVWMTASTERAEIFKALCDEGFTAKTGIGVKVNIMPAGQLNAGAVNALLLSLVSDTAPDVAIGVGTGTPVELAIREAAMDLSVLPGYEALAAEYVPAAMQVNSFMGGVYGMPATMDFLVTFYRKDILSDVGVALPQTWQDVYDYTLPALSQSNLNMYIPQNFNTFLYQHGGSFYTPDGLMSTLETPQAHAAFREMVELYTKYGIPYTTNFFNRFKAGDTPMGIAGFGEYMSLYVGAGNLAGKWGVALIPGTLREDGSIDRSWGGASVSSSGYASAVSTSSVILAGTEYPGEAWEFMKWWASAQTQLDYALELETRLGVGARYNTANLRAFSRLPWPQEDLEVILEAFESFREPGGVLGGYYTNRHITNAWNALITGTSDESVFDLIDQANENIQTELNDKQQEYRHLLERMSGGEKQ